MSADLLREAATLMRGRAEAATPGPWRAESDGDHFSVLECRPELTGGRFSQVATCNGWNDDEEADEPNAEHIASWHPAVALAVAAWLDTAGADLWAHGPLHCAEGCHECDDELWMHHARRALALARAYLGRES